MNALYRTRKKEESCLARWKRKKGGKEGWKKGREGGQEGEGESELNL